MKKILVILILIVTLTLSLTQCKRLAFIDSYESDLTILSHRTYVMNSGDIYCFIDLEVKNIGPSMVKQVKIKLVPFRDNVSVDTSEEFLANGREMLADDIFSHTLGFPVLTNWSDIDKIEYTLYWYVGSVQKSKTGELFVN